MTARALLETGPSALGVSALCTLWGRRSESSHGSTWPTSSDGPLAGELVSKLHAGFTLDPAAGMMEQSRGVCHRKDRAEGPIFYSILTHSPGSLAATGGLSTRWNTECGRQGGPRRGIAFFRRGLPPPTRLCFNAPPQADTLPVSPPGPKKLRPWSLHSHTPASSENPD